MTDKPQQWRCLEPQCPSAGEWQLATDAAATWVEHYRDAHSVALVDPLVDVAVDVVRRAP